MRPSTVLPTGLLYAALHMFLLSKFGSCAPTAFPAPFNGALFPNSRASSFVNAFKQSDLNNQDYSCSKNGQPCGQSGDEDDDDDDEDEDGPITLGKIDYDEYTTPDGTGHVSIGGQTLTYDKDEYTDTGYESDGDYIVDDLSDSEEAEVESEEETQVTDESYTCTRNGYQCGSFPRGSEKDVTIERTKSCTRNGVPCDQFAEGDDEDGEEKFTINKSNDSYKTCTRNGMPCEEYDRLVAQGEVPQKQDEYQIQTGPGHAPQAQQVQRQVQPAQVISQEKAPSVPVQPPVKSGPCSTCAQGDPDDEQMMKAFKKNPGKPGHRGFNWGNQ
ncbi:hypothetical protein DFH27DRAFT_612300 [Peziza echinospora]|nr:hypothetical protein DFH27DRAFT_612300 [Peziza echinospora]